MNVIKMIFGSPAHRLSHILQMENHTEAFEQTKMQTGDDRSRRQKKTKCIKFEAGRERISISSSTQVKSVQTHWTFIAFLCSLWWSLGRVFFSVRASHISWLLIRNRIDSNIYTFTFYEVANGEKCMHELCTCVKIRDVEREDRKRRFALLLLATAAAATARNLFVVSTIFYGRSSI